MLSQQYIRALFSLSLSFLRLLCPMAMNIPTLASPRFPPFPLPLLGSQRRIISFLVSFSPSFPACLLLIRVPGGHKNLVVPFTTPERHTARQFSPLRPLCPQGGADSKRDDSRLSSVEPSVA